MRNISIFIEKSLEVLRKIDNFAASSIIHYNHNKMNAIKKEMIPDMEYFTTTSEIEQNCISVEESKKRVLDMVHKHFQK